MPSTPLMTPAYVQDVLNPDVDRAVNLYPEVQSGRLAWVSTPGTSLAKDLTTLHAAATPVRGLFTTSQGFTFAVAGSGATTYCDFYNGSAWADKLGSAWTSVASGPVFFADNGSDTVITDGTNTISTPSDGSGGKTTLTGIWGASKGRIAFLSGFLAFCNANNEVQVTAPYDVTSVNALDVRAAESSGDPLMGVVTLNSQLLVFGTQSVEAWAVSNATDYPFAPIGGAQQPVGLLAKAGVVVTDNAAYWLGASPNGYPAIYRWGGGAAERISTRAIERILGQATLTNLQACIAWTYQADGHIFVGFNLTVTTGSATGTTVVYDQTTQLWHERRNYAGLLAHPGEFYAAGYGQVFCGGSTSAYVRQLSRTAATDYNASVILRERTAWHATDLPRVTWARYELELDAGSSSNTVPFTIEVSDNGGYTWVSLPSSSAQPLDRTTTRLLVQRAGISRDRAWRFKNTSSTTVPYTILDARARVVGGSA